VDLTAVTVALGHLILERLGADRFVRCGAAPPWCALLRLPALVSEAPFLLEEVFPFLGVFLPDAEACWQRRKPGRAHSGFWTEVGRDGEPVHLEASALIVDDRAVLVITRNERLFEQQEVVLQRARELRLAHDSLTREIEQKDILVHAIVHDLAAPLHAVLGALSLLSELALGEQAAKWIRVALNSALRQRELIGEILDVFSAELGVLTSPPTPGTVADLARAVAEVVSQAEPAARARDAEIRVRIAPGRWPVVAEESRLVRVLANLVHNGIRHSPPGGQVSLSACREDRSVRVDVDDEGPGVSQQLLPYLFERVVAGRAGVAGFGLGLYFCRITAERWGGGIGYERRTRGSRFWLRLLDAEKGRIRA
jgi:signal transduction histidine kinase